MSNTTILELTTASTVTETTDYIPVVDTSDTTETSDGTTKKATVRKILGDKALPGGDIVGTSDTQTLTNKTLTNPSISQSVKFKVTKTSDQNNVSNNDVVVWDSEDYDTGDDFDLANNKFVVPITGYYIIWGSLAFKNTADTQNYGFSIGEVGSGTDLMKSSIPIGKASGIQIPGFTILYLTAATELEMEILTSDSGGTVDIDFDNLCFFGGHLLSI